MGEINNYKPPNELTTLLERSNTGYVGNDEMIRVRGVQNGWNAMGIAKISSKQGENGRGRRFTVLGEPGILVGWC